MFDSIINKLVLATTDFSGLADNTVYPSSWRSVNWARGALWPDQTEEVTIKTIQRGNTVHLTTPLKFTHWGEGYEKAEVGYKLNT